MLISRCLRISTDNEPQGSTIVGFDVQPVQPKLGILDKSLARRLKWVHGNLYGSQLPVLAGSIHTSLSDSTDCRFLTVNLTLYGWFVWACIFQKTR